MIAPPLKPPPPAVTLDDRAPLRRIQFRLWQIGWAAAVVLVTGWCYYTLGPWAGITATVIAKHVLVAIIAAGLELPDEERA
jgi:hypothetical protein